MIENSMFEEEPDVVDLAKEPCLHPLEPDEIEYEPRSSRLLVRGLGEHEMDEDEEDYESSAKLLGMSFMNRSTGLRNSAAGYRQSSDGSCSVPSTRTMVVCAVVLLIAVSVVMVIYLLPKCTFTKEGCHKKNHTMELIYPLATNGKRFPWAKVRLPSNVVPLHYDLVLQPNLTTTQFSGSVQITVNVIQVTWNIILHSSGLTITKTTLTSARWSQAKPVEFLEYPVRDQIAIVAPEALLVGQNYTLSIDYSSNLSDTYYGFYKVSYKDESTKRWLAATQFEPLAARSAFPCFDEPSFKATFLIKIKRDEQHMALSNMPKNVTVPVANGIVQDEFSVSLKMSTYLVAFIVANLTSIMQGTNRTQVSIYAMPQKVTQVEYALNITVKLLEFYQKYFYIDYPLQKLDLVAIPDFQTGAMENWGLITFSETTLLYEDNTSSARDKKLVTAVIAHELAHQWFGNLVTMEWWNDLWLNEGFATFMEYFAMENIFPELPAAEEFLKLRFKTMMKDSLNASRPISFAVQSSEQIEEMFDTLSYIKGASLLLMLKKYMKEDSFQAGIEHYLHSHSYGCTRSDDLWDSMNKITNGTLDVKKMMITWILQKGFPLVTIQRNGKTLLVHQERFLRSVEPENWTSDASYLWHIPLSYTTSSCSSVLCPYAYLLDQKSATIELQEEVNWVKFNVDMDGYYIVHYAEEDWEALTMQLKSDPSALSAKDRAHLINNIFTLASVGKVSLQKAFHLLDYLERESDTAPVTEAVFQLSLIYGLLEKSGMQDLTARIVHRIEKLLGSKIEQQTWTDNGSLSERVFRSMVLAFACSHRLGNCSSTALKLFEDWKASNGTKSLPSDVMKTVFTAGAKTNAGWEFLLSVYMSPVPEAEKYKILEALASTEDVRKLIWLMQKSLEGDDIRAQEVLRIIATVSQSLPGHLVAWDFVKENWEKLIQKFHLGSHIIQSMVTVSTSQFSTEAHLLEVKTFFESKSAASSQLRCVKEAIETIQLNIKWMKTNLAELQQWL
ncbi:leucyl-cystinyl aminopeptidase isoform X2 [Carettochelys insculpta]